MQHRSTAGPSTHSPERRRADQKAKARLFALLKAHGYQSAGPMVTGEGLRFVRGLQWLLIRPSNAGWECRVVRVVPLVWLSLGNSKTVSAPELRALLPLIHQDEQEHVARRAWDLRFEAQVPLFRRWLAVLHVGLAVGVLVLLWRFTQGESIWPVLFLLTLGVYVLFCRMALDRLFTHRP